MMKISRKMQRQVEFKIRYAMAIESPKRAPVMVSEDRVLEPEKSDSISK